MIVCFRRRQEADLISFFNPLLLDELKLRTLVQLYLKTYAKLILQMKLKKSKTSCSLCSDLDKFVFGQLIDLLLKKKLKYYWFHLVLASCMFIFRLLFLT